MTNRNLVKELGLDHEIASTQAEELLKEHPPAELKKIYEESVKNFQPDTIIKGRILNSVGDDVLVDIGYKSEGVVPKSDFGHPDDIKIGEDIEVLLESIEDEAGVLVLSKQKADKIRGWERIITSNKEGDVISGRVIRKIKGGLLVDVGVPVFLPASQVDVRRIEDIGEFLGRKIECKILKIDEKRMNVIVSRRRLLEEQRAEAKTRILETLQAGEIRKGVVKNIADFGAFVDLGGIDGLLHITDMSWGRVNNPSEVVKMDEEIEVKVLRVDRNSERIALGLKQLQPNPWVGIAEKYPSGARCRGRVTNLMPYGAFVELEDGVEGLVHVSEMSWTKRINHPSEILKAGDEIDIMVLSIDVDKQELSLGLKQTEENPWDKVAEKFPVGTQVSGRVRNTTSYGAFVELEEGIDGLLHINDMSWTKKVSHPNEIVRKGDSVEVVILTSDSGKKRIALGLKQLTENPWEVSIPIKYAVESKVEGIITKLVSFGAFVELEKDLEGLLHISKMDKEPVGEGLSVDDRVEVRVVKLEPAEGKIGLALERVVERAKKEEKPEEKPEEKAEEKAEETPEQKPEEKPEQKPEEPEPSA